MLIIGGPERAALAGSLVKDCHSLPDLAVVLGLHYLSCPLTLHLLKFGDSLMEL